MTHPLDQPEFVRVFEDMKAEMRRRREAGEFGLSAPPLSESREDWERKQRGEDWV